MIQKPYACFGYVILRNTDPAGYVCNVQTLSASNTVQFLTKGHMVAKNKETGEVLDEYFPGTFLTEWKDRLAEVTAMEETVLFCLTPELNRGYIPDVTPIILQTGESNFFEAGTKFFLCQGTAEVNGAEFTGPCQIGFRGPQELKTKTDVYGMVIK